MTIKRLNANLLIEDFDLYPRSAVDSTVVTEIMESLRSGRKIPPIIVDEKTLRIIDGFHRRRAILKLYKDNPMIECELKKYNSIQEMYLDAVAYNRARGKDITGSELTHAILKGLELKIEPEVLAEAVHITTQRVDEIINNKAVKIEATNTLIPLKGSVRHLKGAKVTKKQAIVIDHASGTQQWLLIQQVNDLIENDLLNLDNERVVYELKRLKKLITKLDI